MMDEMRGGDRLTIAGVMMARRNPDRRWWQLWKPRFVASELHQTFVIVEMG